MRFLLDRIDSYLLFHLWYRHVITANTKEDPHKCWAEMPWFQAQFCKRLPSHTGQEQACSRFTRLFVRDHAKNGPIHRKMVVACPLVITSKVKFFFRPNKTRKGEWMVQPVFCIVDIGSCLIMIQIVGVMIRKTWNGTESRTMRKSTNIFGYVRFNNYLRILRSKI